MRCRGFRYGLGLLLLAAFLPVIPAQESDPSMDGQIREAMWKYFEQRLRADLGVTDDQMEQIRPLAERMERAKNELRHERTQTTRRLRMGLREGATDTELQEMLDRLTQIVRQEQEENLAGLTEIDKLLTVRQRVRYRFLTVEFRRDIQQRIEQLRGERTRPDRRGRPGARR